MVTKTLNRMIPLGRHTKIWAVLDHRVSWVVPGSEAGKVSRAWISRSLAGSTAHLKVLDMKGRNGNLKNSLKAGSSCHDSVVNESD